MQKSDSPLESNFFSAKWKTTTCKAKPVSQDYIPLPIQNLVPGQDGPLRCPGLPRYWRPGYPPAKALWIMRQDWQQSGMFDVGLLVELIKFIAGEEK